MDQLVKIFFCCWLQVLLALEHLHGKKNNLTTIQGSQIESVTSSYGLSQLMRDPIHVL